MKKYLILLLIPMVLLLGSCTKKITEDALKGPFLQPSQASTSGISVSFDWVPATAPQPMSDEWYAANHSLKDIFVSTDEGALVALEKPVDYPAEIATVHGKLVGEDKGEWGGSIKFMPDTGKDYTLVEENFQGFYTLEGRLFALTGLAHMGIDEGAIYEIIFRDGRWAADGIAKLDGCPEAFSIVDNMLYLVTSNSLSTVSADGMIETLLDEAFWEGLYPTSIVCADTVVFIGMRGGVYSWDSDSNDGVWYDFTD